VVIIVILVSFLVSQPTLDSSGAFGPGIGQDVATPGTSPTSIDPLIVNGDQGSLRADLTREGTPQLLDPSDPCVYGLDYVSDRAYSFPSNENGGPYLHLKIGSFDPLLADPPDIASFPSPPPGSPLVVQFDGTITLDWKASLLNAGIEIRDYLPDHAYVVEAGSVSPKEIEAIDGVRWVGPILPSWKVDPRLFKELDGTTGIDLDISLVRSYHKGEFFSLFSDIGVDTFEFGTTDLHVTVPGNRIGDLAKLLDVIWIEPTPSYKVLNDLAADVMEVDTIWTNVGLDGSGQTVAVCDTGLDTGTDNHFINNDIHLDFDNRVTFFNWYGSSPNDLNGHGTHVSGTIMGDGTRSAGQFKGMAYNATVVHQAAAPNVDSTSLYPPSNLNNLYSQAYNAGARIHSNSWGNDDYGEYTSDSRETDQFMWNNPEMLILFAAGNDGSSTNTINDPSTAKNCIAVGATYSSRNGNPESVPSFSSRGYTDDGRLKPDIIAPGTAIISARSSVATDEPCSSWGSYNTYYTKCGGTSMATPATAGVVTLIRQYFMDFEGITPSAALLKATLLNGAKDVTGISAAIPNHHEGWGRVNITASLRHSPGPNESELRYIDHPTGLGQAESHSFQVRVSNSSEPLKVTLTWTDYPGNVLSPKNLINDLHLRVVSPDPQIAYKGNVMSNGVSLSGGSYDTTNNVEKVIIANPVPGIYTIQILGSDIPMGPQPFAIALSGIFNNTPPQVIINTPNLGWFNSDPGLVVDVDFSNGGGTALLDSAQYKVGSGGDTWYDIFTADAANYTTNWNVNWNLLSEGPNIVHVRVFDTDGFEDLTFDSFSIFVDTTPPTVQLNQVLYGWYSQDPGEVVDADLSDGLLGSMLDRVEYHMPGVGFLGMVPLFSSSGSMEDFPLPWSNLSDGENTLEFKVFDQANNEDETQDFIMVLVDTLAPVITVNKPEYGWYSSAPGAVVDVDFSNGGNGTLLDWASYKLDPNANWNMITNENTSSYETDWGVDWNEMPEGVSTYSIKAADGMGHLSVLPSVLTFYKDTIPPSVIIRTPSLGWFNTDPGPIIDVDFNAGTNDDISSLVYASYRIDGRKDWLDIFSTNSTANISGLLGETDPIIMNYTDEWGVLWDRLFEGPNRIELQVSDGAGNIAFLDDGVTILKDTMAPVITVNQRLYGCLVSDPGPIIDVEFSDGPWSSGLASAHYRLSRDGAWISIPLPIGTEYKGPWALDWDLLSDGDYSIDIQLTDKAGNTQLRLDAILISKDGSSPLAPLPISPGKGEQLPQNGPYLFTWDMPDCGCVEATGYVIRIELADGPLRYPKEFDINGQAVQLDPGLDPGNYSWRLKAVDANDRIGPWSEEWRFSIKNETAPTTPDEGPGDDQQDEEPTIEDDPPPSSNGGDDEGMPPEDIPGNDETDDDPPTSNETDPDGPKTNETDDVSDETDLVTNERRSDSFILDWWLLLLIMAVVVSVLLIIIGRSRKKSGIDEKGSDEDPEDTDEKESVKKDG